MFRHAFFVSLMGLACLTEVGESVAIKNDELLAGIGLESGSENLLPELFSAQRSSTAEDK